MKDPKRIPTITKELRLLWMKHPDLRLYQLLWALTAHRPGISDPFSVEDEELLGWIKQGLHRGEVNETHKI